MSITSLMHQHHVHCDDLFAAAEDICRSADWARAETALDSFINQTDGHFAAEEEVLFPAFEQATGMVSGPTAMMRMEHQQMRALFTQMRASVGTHDTEGFAGAAETLLVLMQQHNMKEENILYPMCERALPDDATEGALRSRLATPN
jgi:hemerythrin-like domain-containing protein